MIDFDVLQMLFELGRIHTATHRALVEIADELPAESSIKVYEKIGDISEAITRYHNFFDEQLAKYKEKNNGNSA